MRRSMSCCSAALLSFPLQRRCIPSLTGVSSLDFGPPTWAARFLAEPFENAEAFHQRPSACLGPYPKPLLWIGAGLAAATWDGEEPDERL